MRVTIVGAGAIGGIAGARMAMAAERVTFVDKSEVRWSHAPFEDKAREVGIAVPLNARLHQMIYEIEEHRRELGWHNFDELRLLIRSLGKEYP